MKFNKVIIITISLSIIFTACEKVIEINLNSANKTLVVEAYIEKDSVSTVVLSYTGDYFDAEDTEKVENATVTILADNGNSEVLDPIGNGFYRGRNLIGTAGTNYTLNIVGENYEYSATSTLYAPVTIDSVLFREIEFQGPGRDKQTYGVQINFSDNPLEENYYLFRYIVNDEFKNSYYLTDDNSVSENGYIEHIQFRLRFELQDEVSVHLYTIDKAAYEYYNQLGDNSGNMMNSSVPYNPKSNFGSEVVGFFVARSYVSEEAVVNL